MSVPDGARLLELTGGEVIDLGDRFVRVCVRPDGRLCRDYRNRIAARNFATNRLSYIQEWRLLKALRARFAPSPREERPA